MPGPAEFPHNSMLLPLGEPLFNANGTALAIVLLALVSSWLLRRAFSAHDAVKLFHCAVNLSPRLHVDHGLSTDQVAGSNDLTLVDLVRSRCTTLCDSLARFKGVWWLPGAHAQTIYCSLGDFSKVDPVVYERRLLKVRDGGIIAIDVTPPFTTSPVKQNERILLVTHGLTGGSQESYVRAALTTLTRRESLGGLGLRAVVINFRGCNGSPVVTPKLYHAGSSEDVRPVVAWICHTFPECHIFGLGFSLGANILTRYVGEEGDACPLSCMVGLANVWDFVEGSYHIEHGTLANRLIYQNVLGGALRALLHSHKKAFLLPESPLHPSTLRAVFNKRTISLREYDELVTAPLYGFADADDYYRSISSSAFISGIRIPCLGINSLDDPIVGERNLPIAQVSENPWVVLATTQHGGHMGWFERDPDSGMLRRWYVKPVQEYLAAIIECRLNPRPKPKLHLDQDGFWTEEGINENGFVEAGADQVVRSGMGESRLFSGW